MGQDSLAQMLQADEIGVRLEIVGGLPLWEAHPLPSTTPPVDRIRASIARAEPPARIGCWRLWLHPSSRRVRSVRRWFSKAS